MYNPVESILNEIFINQELIDVNDIEVIIEQLYALIKEKESLHYFENPEATIEYVLNDEK